MERLGSGPAEWISRLAGRGELQGNLRLPAFADPALELGNIDPDGSRGYEGDNNEDNFDASPRSDPKFCNVTLIGAKGQPGGTVSNRGAVLRRGTAGKFAQTIITQMSTAGIRSATSPRWTSASPMCASNTLTGPTIVLARTMFGMPPSRHCCEDQRGSGSGQSMILMISRLHSA